MYAGYLFNMYSVKYMYLNWQLLMNNIICQMHPRIKYLWLRKNIKHNLIVCSLCIIILQLHENMFEVLCIDMNAPNYPKCKRMLICCVWKNTFPVEKQGLVTTK